MEPALWLFVTVTGLEPTNNAAERAIRLAVLWRRTSFGSQSEAGSVFVARMWGYSGKFSLVYNGWLSVLPLPLLLRTIKVRLPDGTTVSVKAFSSGNNEDYILHWAAIFRLFDQKGLKQEWCRFGLWGK